MKVQSLAKLCCCCSLLFSLKNFVNLWFEWNGMELMTMMIGLIVSSTCAHSSAVWCDYITCGGERWKKFKINLDWHWHRHHRIAVTRALSCLGTAWQVCSVISINKNLALNYVWIKDAITSAVCVSSTVQRLRYFSYSNSALEFHSSLHFLESFSVDRVMRYDSRRLFSSNNNLTTT